MRREQRRAGNNQIRGGRMAENIYKVSRRIKRTEQTVYNALRSIYEDSLFVLEIRDLWKALPLLANLRCGLWYASQFDGTCYFKSTDGHNGNWSFSTVRLNLHIATLAAERGGCCIVDATRKGKRFPDSMSKTIPIWACVLNRAIADFRPPRTQEEKTHQSLLKSSDTTQETCRFVSREAEEDLQKKRSTTQETDSFVQKKPTQETCSLISGEEQDLQKKPSTTQETGEFFYRQDEELLQTKPSTTPDWDCSLHLPLWVSDVEKANIESRIDGWVEALKSTGVDLAALANLLKKPLRPLWISQKTVIWLNEVPDLDDWDFTPIILVSASRQSAFTQRFADAEFSWSYIPGAADDEESWARGLTPDLFWKNSLDIISGGPSACNGKVSDIVEKDRVYKAVRGHYAPQVRAKAGVPSKLEEVRGGLVSSSGTGSNGNQAVKPFEKIQSFQSNGEASRVEGIAGYPIDSPTSSGRRSFPVLGRVLPGNIRGFYWIGSTGLAVGNADCGNRDSIFEVVDCIINCGTSSTLSLSSHTDSFLYLPIVGPKIDRYSLQNHLAKAVAFAVERLRSGLSVFICCSNGEDISVCVCLAVLLSCFSSHGEWEDRLMTDKVVTKSDVRQYLIYLSSFNSDARPSRGSLRQVFNFFNPTGA